jgi:hypothetical protein
MKIVTQDGIAETPGKTTGEFLYLAPADMERATSWTLKPEGLCRDDVCVPARPEWLKDGQVDVAGFWRHLGRAVAHDGDVWVLGEAAAERAAALQSLEMQDFALPDLAGQTHRLSDHAGKKILLTTWASW